MIKIKRLAILFPIFAILGSCGVNYEYQERDNTHDLINAHKQNTYAFLGNSITHDGRYHSYFELFLLTRYPDVDFTFINAGVSGDQAGIALARLQDDVLIHNPDVVTVMFGMNDIGRNLYGHENLLLDSMIAKQNQNIANYTANLDSLTRVILNSDADVVLFTPSIYEQNAVNLATANMFGCNDALERCALIVKDINEKYDTYLVNQFAVMDSLNNLLQKENPDTTIVGPDRVHPQDAGHFIMAYAIISQLGYSPLVASVEIDVTKNKVVGTNARIDQLIMDDNMLRFSYNPEALPFPTQNIQDVAAFLDFNNSLNREMLVVSGLTAGDYKLTINSTEISIFDATALEKGINLSNYITPQQMYASEIARLVEEKRQIVSNKMRNIAFIEYFYAPGVMQATDSLDAIRIVEERLEQDFGKSYYSYLEDQVNLYKEVKMELPELKNKVDSLNQEIDKLRNEIPVFEIVLEKTSV
jgi:lysophospholipase L1-like esterase